MSLYALKITTVLIQFETFYNLNRVLNNQTNNKMSQQDFL